jgi:hypothetical protein
MSLPIKTSSNYLSFYDDRCTEACAHDYENYKVENSIYFEMLNDFIKNIV